MSQDDPRIQGGIWKVTNIRVDWEPMTRTTVVHKAQEEQIC